MHHHITTTIKLSSTCAGVYWERAQSPPSPCVGSLCFDMGSQMLFKAVAGSVSRAELSGLQMFGSVFGIGIWTKQNKITRKLLRSKFSAVLCLPTFNRFNVWNHVCSGGNSLGSVWWMAQSQYSTLVLCAYYRYVFFFLSHETQMIEQNLSLYLFSEWKWISFYLYCVSQNSFSQEEARRKKKSAYVGHARETDAISWTMIPSDACMSHYDWWWIVSFLKSSGRDKFSAIHSASHNRQTPPALAAKWKGTPCCQSVLELQSCWKTAGTNLLV